MCDNKFSWKKRAKSFVFAFAGIKIVLKNEHNAWIHLLIASLVLIFGLIFNLSSLEWVAILLCIGIVFMAEAFNTSIETLADSIVFRPQKIIVKKHRQKSIDKNELCVSVDSKSKMQISVLIIDVFGRYSYKIHNVSML